MHSAAALVFYDPPQSSFGCVSPRAVIVGVARLAQVVLSEPITPSDLEQRGEGNLTDATE